tara:strand:+ start:348 stop:1229 length:882 start_codon:yes stop_codon:yes gene_type:complete
MNQFKNKIKILIRNIKTFCKFFINNEIPKKSIYSSKVKIKTLKDLNEKSDRPKLILSSNYHRVLNSRFKEFSEMFSILQGFDILFFNHKDRDKYMKRHWEYHPIYDVYKKSAFHQMKSDIFRYCFLYQNGGYWLDFKSSVFFDINNLMNESQETLLVCSSEKIDVSSDFLSENKLLDITKESYINNWVLGSKKNSKFLKELIENISIDYLQYIDKEYEYPKKAILELTGPFKLTKLFYQYLNKENNRLKEFSIIHESEFKLVYVSDHGRDFKIMDNVFRKHYSNIKNKKILSI